MKKLGLIFFIAALAVGVILANVFSFGEFIYKSPVKLPFLGKIQGSGNLVKQKRDVPRFEEVKVGGAFEVEIQAQSEHSLEIEADDNLLSLITTEVRGDRLIIESEKSFQTKNPVKIRISAENIEVLDISGASRTNLKNLDNEFFRIDLSGASKVTVAGKTVRFDIDMSGASRVDSSDLQASNVSVEGSGASSADVNVSEILSADLSGATRVKYAGNPNDITKKTSGASSICQKK